VELYLYFPVCLNCVMLNKHTEKFTFLLTLLFTAQNPLWSRASSLSRLHDHTQCHTTHSVGHLWTSDQPVAEILHHTTLPTDRHPCPGGIRTRNPRNQEVADPRFRPRGHWDRNFTFCLYEIILNKQI